MTITDVYTLLSSNKIDKLKEILQLSYDVALIEKAVKQYDPEKHNVMDPLVRKDKPIKDSEGNITEYKNVHRIPVPNQRNIVLLRSMFIGDPNMQATPENELQINCLNIIGKIWDDNKMGFRFMETKKRTMSELRCAWLWYNVENMDYWKDQPIKSKLQPKVKVLSHQLGDALYPVFDNNNDLVAFARGYNSIEYDANFDKIEVENMDIYTSERIYFKKKVNSEWLDNYLNGDIVANVDGVSFKPNLVKKIPITYFEQAQPEWHDIQRAADRIDEVYSTHADTNDYFGNPILFGTGSALTLPQKGDAGKYVEGDAGADLKFVTWNNAPESIKMEIENLQKIINNLSYTPDISFKEMQGIGAMSGFAIQLMFLGATLKAKECEMSIFGEGVQRAYNYLKALISVLDGKYLQTLSFKITPDFASALPTDILEELDKIVKAKGAGIMSAETSIEQNPLVEDKEVEKIRLSDEADAKAEAEAAKSTFKIGALS